MGELIGTLAQAESDREAGYLADPLNGLLTDAESDGFYANPAKGARFLGTAVHNAVALALEDLAPGRFIYQTIGPDFIDTQTGEIIELTTPGGVAGHAARYGWPVTTNAIVTYTLP
jgi:hypothetical protein